MTTPNQPIPLPLEQDGTPFSAIAYPQPGPPGLPGAKGEPGKQGPPGPPGVSPGMWVGQGEPPEFIEGAKPGDTWLDTNTGNTYRLE